MVKICILCQVYIYLTYSYNFVKFLYLYKYFPGNLLIYIMNLLNLIFNIIKSVSYMYSACDY